ncbi:MAG: hypothetical protein GX601_01175 [Anaerolineales bacterium]|nr:hypothetical protein [Anaerolineales bacterium]
MGEPFRRLRSCVPPLRLLVLFLIIYGLSAGVSLARHSLAPHFVYLAESFLQGRTDLVHVPDPPYDLTPYNGRWYVSFPPLPALLMAPLVALRGLAVSDIAFSVVLGAADVALFYIVLSHLDRSAGLRLRPSVKAWLAVFLGAGTPLWYCAALGSVWYTAHVVAVACTSLYLLEVFGRNRPLLAGLWLGLGFLARGPLILAFPVALTMALAQRRDARHVLGFAVQLAGGAAPAVLGQAAYNWARFGSPLEFGYRWMNSPSLLQDRLAAWGQFSVHFLPENLYTLLVRPPLVTLSPLQVTPDPWGMGLVFAMPVLLLALPGLRRLGRDAHRSGLWLSVGLVALPSLLYFNTGSYQFGYRFALDWLPMAILLLALESVDRHARWKVWCGALVLVSVLTHLWGLLWMYPNFNGQAWVQQYFGWLR